VMLEHRLPQRLDRVEAVPAAALHPDRHGGEPS
jgi:hypothetical protein